MCPRTKFNYLFFFAGGLPVGRYRGLQLLTMLTDYIALGVNKWTIFENVDLSNIVLYNATDPDPYCTKKHNQCI